MLRSYLAIAFRHIVGQKLYSAINIAGLAVGLACFILIGLYVQHELGYDRQYANADRIYRISRDFDFADAETLRYASIVPGIAALMEQDFPQIERAARVALTRLPVSRNQDDTAIRETVAVADNALLDIFRFDWQRGDPATALSEPFTAVLQESIARKYFGEDEALGATFILDGSFPVRVTGVMADLPQNTHLEFDLLVSMASGRAVLGDAWLENNANWTNNAFHTYVLLERGTDVSAIQSQSGEFFERHFTEGASAWTGFSADPLTGIYLDSTRAGEMKASGNRTTVYAFAAIGALILLLACINFMNLATAIATRRAREIGVRKAIGAERGQVIAQHLGESIVLALIAVVFAVALTEIALPVYEGFVGVNFRFNYLREAATVVAVLVLAIVVGLVAGAYPAFYVSGFNPVRVLKDDVTRGAAAGTLRKALVVAQFSISIALIIATVLVFQQLRFARDLDLGYRTDQIVLLDVDGFANFRQRWETARRRLLAHPEITHATVSSTAPGNQGEDSVGVRAEGGDPQGRGMNYMMVDFDFFETYEIEVLAGRAFSEEFQADRSLLESDGGTGPRGAYMLNELAARQFGWAPEEAVGKWLEIFAGAFFQDVRGPVIGVARDIHLRTLHEPIEPVFYMIPPERMFGGAQMLQQVALRISGRGMSDALDHIDATWAEFVPDRPVARRFLSEQFAALYRAEQQQAHMLTAFSLLAIFIACLGLFGLASFATEQRTKEIGVRKVMGGTMLDIVRLFIGEFGKLVLLANLIAWPIAWLLMQRWLENFAYRIDVNVIVFVASALLALSVAVATVGAIAARAAAASPIHSLRYE